MSLNNSQPNTDGPGSTNVTTESECRICSNVLGEAQEKEGELWNKILAETDEYVCSPTVGALTEGYVLTIPKSHALCAGALSEEQLERYWAFTTTVAEQVRNEFGEVTIFEHGPAVPNTQIGCGVDHAHMHVVPIEGPLVSHASEMNSCSIKWESVDSVKQLVKMHHENTEYLFIQKGDNTPLIGTSSTISSQLFRRAIAQITGVPEKYDWRRDAFTKNVQRTVDRLEINIQ